MHITCLALPVQVGTCLLQELGSLLCHQRVHHSLQLLDGFLRATHQQPTAMAVVTVQVAQESSPNTGKEASAILSSAPYIAENIMY